MKKSPPFTASQFTPTKWNTAEQKAKFANHFIRFAELNFPYSLFYDWFYRRLSMTFGHIAHYDRAGFYTTFFTDPEGIQQFWEQTCSYPCYGDPAYTYSDVERAIQRYVSEHEEVTYAAL